MLVKVRVERRDAARFGDLARVGRLDSLHPMSAALEVGEQRAVVGSDVDDEVLCLELEQLVGLFVQRRKIVAQNARCATRVGIARRKDDLWIDGQPELHELALRTIEQVGRVGGLLGRNAADGAHLIDGRQ